MKIIRYVPSEHQADLLAVMEERKIPSEYLEDLPSNGYVVLINNKVVAAGFIRLIEGKQLCLIDSVIASLTVDRTVRDVALDKLVRTLIKESHKQGYKGVMCLSCIPSVLTRASRHGFVHVPHVVMRRQSE